MWQSKLAGSGIAVIPVDARHVRLVAGSRAGVFAVRLTSGRIHPARLSPPTEPSIVIGRTISDYAAMRIKAQGWSVIVDDGPGWIDFGGQTYLFPAPVPEPAAPRRRRGRPGWSTWNVVRWLGATPGGVTQKELTGLIGVSQPRISTILRELADSGLVETGAARRWQLTDRRLMEEFWLEHYPGAGGLTTHWAGPPAAREQATVSEQATTAIRVLTQLRATTAVSAPVAAERTAGRCAPTIVYADAGADLVAAGLHPADPARATLALTVPADPGILRHRQLLGDGPARVDAWQQLWDHRTAPERGA